MDKKKIKKLCMLVLLIPFFVSAQSVNDGDSAVYINNNNVAIPVETYNNLRFAYSAQFISALTQERYDAIIAKNIDYSNIETTIKYYKYETNIITGETNNTEVDEDEYENSSNLSPVRGTYIETGYKRVALSVSSVSSAASVILSCIWKTIPSTRSYDVLGFRFEGSSVINGTQTGTQTYILSGSTYSINYSWNGTNINRQSNGFGISQNLVDSSITFLENIIDVDIALSSNYNNIFATYQHATSNISLANSKNYTIAAGGLGNVLDFAGSIGNHYDAMQGLYTSL